MKANIFLSICIIIFSFSCKNKTEINSNSKLITDSINNDFIESAYIRDVNTLQRPYVKMTKEEYDNYMSLSRYWTEYLDLLWKYYKQTEKFTKQDLILISKKAKSLDNHLASSNDKIIEFKIIEFKRHQRAANEILTLLSKSNNEENDKILISKLRKQYLIIGSRVLKFLNEEHWGTWRFAPFLHFYPYKNTITKKGEFHAEAIPVTGLDLDYEMANPFLINVLTKDTTYLKSKDGQIEINIKPTKIGSNKYHLYVPITDWRFDTTMTIQEIEFFVK